MQHARITDLQASSCTPAAHAKSLHMCFTILPDHAVTAHWRTWDSTRAGSRARPGAGLACLTPYDPVTHPHTLTRTCMHPTQSHSSVSDPNLPKTVHSAQPALLQLGTRGGRLWERFGGCRAAAGQQIHCSVTLASHGQFCCFLAWSTWSLVLFFFRLHATKLIPLHQYTLPGVCTALQQLFWQF